MMTMKPTRRNLLFGFAGLASGTVITGTVGLTYREIRRRQYIPAPKRSAPAGDDGWLISHRERQKAATYAAQNTNTSG